MNDKTFGLVIRAEKQLKNMDSRLVEALKNSIGENYKAIPVVCQYLHKPGEELVVDSDNTIGKVTNIRFNGKGDVVGDFEIMNILKIATNFQGTVDNIAASAKPNGKGDPKFAVDALIIYDKLAKEEILRKKRDMERQLMESDFCTRLAKPGEIPIVPSATGKASVAELLDVTEKLVDEFKNRVAQPINEEGGD